MNILMNLPLFLAPPVDGAAQSGSSMMSLAMIGSMILIFYFLIMRPQSKKQKEAKKMMDSLKKGDKITTIGGIRGTVESVKDDVVSVRVDGNTKIDFIKSAISSVANQAPTPETDKSEKKEEK